MFVDTHCHLDSPSLAGQLPQVLTRAESVGVNRFIVPGVSPAGWDRLISLSAMDRRILAAPGIHPMHADQLHDETLAKLETLVPDAVAIGEIGLDYGYDILREVQQPAFREQLRLAVGLGIPVIIHCRRAFADLLRILREEKVSTVGGVMHAFSGSPEIAAECVSLALRIGIAGPVTYHNAVRPVEVVRRIPLEHLLLETDSPDLSPVPYRRCVNEPSFLVETAKVIAIVKGVSLERVATVTSSNAKELFRLK